MSRKTFARAGLAALCLAVLCALSSCVDQHPARDGGDERSGKRIVATSPAVASMCDRLDLDLVGVPATSRALPQRYGDAEVVGPPMLLDFIPEHEAGRESVIEILNKLATCPLRPASISAIFVVTLSASASTFLPNSVTILSASS